MMYVLTQRAILMISPAQDLEYLEGALIRHFLRALEHEERQA
jgi:hypothetical protein